MIYKTCKPQWVRDTFELKHCGQIREELAFAEQKGRMVRCKIRESKQLGNSLVQLWQAPEGALGGQSSNGWGHDIPKPPTPEKADTLYMDMLHDLLDFIDPKMFEEPHDTRSMVKWAKETLTAQRAKSEDRRRLLWNTHRSLTVCVENCSAAAEDRTL